jgi:hypothetical protein
VHAIVLSKNKRQILSLDASAVNRALIENDLIEEYHWLPQDIAKIPYKKLLEFFIIRREKNEARRTAQALEEERAKNKEKGR